MAIFEPVWASGPGASITVLTDAQVEQGWTCGAADPGAFNWWFQRIETTINALNVEEMVPLARLVGTGAGLTGGGDLSQDRTINLNWPGLETKTGRRSNDLIAVYDQEDSKHVTMTANNFLAGLLEEGVISGGDNIGGGADVFSAVNENVMEFRTIVGGTGLVATVVGDTVEITFDDMGAALTAD